MYDDCIQNCYFWENRPFDLHILYNVNRINCCNANVPLPIPPQPYQKYGQQNLLIFCMQKCSTDRIHCSMFCISLWTRQFIYKKKMLPLKKFNGFNTNTGTFFCFNCVWNEIYFAIVQIQNNFIRKIVSCWYQYTMLIII